MAGLETWSRYRESIGDRSALFALLGDAWQIERALYPGSYVDLSPSTAIRSVTYVDVDRRATRLFADLDRVRAELAGRTRPGAGEEVSFHAGDFTRPLPVPDGSQDLLISLFASAVWDNCRRYLRPGGLLLANTSHGDASLAALDGDARLVGVVEHRDDRYRLDAHRLGSYLVPKRPESAAVDLIRRAGRGIAYTRSAFAYVFEIA